jgi:hypothetical protein
MIDEILQFHDKGEEIIQNLCETVGADIIEIDFQYYDNSTIKMNHDFSQEIFDFLFNQLEQETDVIRRKCLIFILASSC